MTKPTPRTDIVEKTRLTPYHQFHGSVVMDGILRSYALQCQELENAIISVWLLVSIDESEGIQLDRIGRIVNEPRGEKSDSDYRAALRARIRWLRGSGRRVDIEDAMHAADGGSYLVRSLTRASVYVEKRDRYVVSPDVLFAVLSATRAAGVDASLSLSDEADVLTMAEGDVFETDTERGFSDDAGTVGGYTAEYRR
jgi:phosphatidylserine/phosphatidylglycerophosphate/cardiolipin synthase-like enzyme